MIAHKQKLDSFIHSRNLRWTQQRQQIVDIFLAARQHLTCEELFERVRKRQPGIGYATVSRTLHLLVDAGVCTTFDIGDGTMRYETAADHSHHDHLVCTWCGKFVEIYSPELEALQARLVKQHGFSEEYHKLQIFGLCPQCRRQKEAKPR